MSRGWRRPNSRKFGPYRTGATKSLSCASTTTSTYAYRTLWKIINQYTNTLCTTQKQTNLTDSLLEDITVFNEYDSTKLEDGLMDMETAADQLVKVELNSPKPNQVD